MSKKPEKSTVIGQIIGASAQKEKRGRNGSKQQSVYLTDDHIKAVGFKATIEGVSKSEIIQRLIEKELKAEIDLIREKTALRE